MARRYVILRHEGIPEPHFDLMFEQARSPLLGTLRSPIWPITRPTSLVHLGDHRREYLEYEGPVSGNRGAVRRVESGRHWLVERGIGEWEVKLSGTAGDHGFILRCTFRPAETWEAEPLV
jgi:hypothetical protein